MGTIAYLSFLKGNQAAKFERHALLKYSGLSRFDREFADQGLLSAVPAMQRPRFAALFDSAREGDVVYVFAIARLGRDASDVQATVLSLLSKGVVIEVCGLGRMVLGQDASRLLLAVLGQVGDMERQRTAERIQKGRAFSREHQRNSANGGRGKASVGRPIGRTANGGQVTPLEVAQWRRGIQASIRVTAQHFHISESTVKRYCRQAQDDRQ